MDREWRDEWIRALLSGEFTQGVGRLRFNGKHDCLGVLCEILPNVRWVDDGAYVDKPEAATSGFLPAHAAADVGLSGRQHTLVDMNDSGKTFADIAKYITAYL